MLKPLLICMALAVSGYALADGLGPDQQPRSVKSTRQPAQQNQQAKKNKNNPTTIKPRATEDHEIHSNNNTSQKNPDSNPPWGRPIERIGAGLVAVTCILLVWQVCVLRRQTGANIVAAKAAQKSADTAREALTIVERGWLIIETLHLDFNPDPPLQDGNDIIGFQPIIRNVGRVAAFVVERRDGWHIYDSLPITPRYEDVDSRAKQFWVPSSESIKVLSGGRLLTPSKEEFQTWGAGHLPTLYFFGCLKYRDLFNHTHETGFCFIIPWGGGPPIQSGGDAYNYYT